MAYRLAIIDPPEADYFSFAALSAANEKIYFSAIFAARVPLQAGRAVNTFLNFAR
jgi:hypothetical protein